MLKKFVSNALLSVVMDKKARERLQAAKESKKHSDQPTASTSTPEIAAPGNASRASSGKKSPKKKSDFQARADRYGALLAGAAPPSGDAVEEDTADLVRQALESAESELANNRDRKPMTPNRKALIDQAMAIHKSKSHILDDLDDESREKLYVMAMEALKDQRSK